MPRLARYDEGARCSWCPRLLRARRPLVLGSNSDFEVSERVGLQTVRVGSVGRYHPRVDRRPISPCAVGIHASRVAGAQNDRFTVTLDVEFAFHNDGRLRVRMEVLPTASVQLPLHEYEVIPRTDRVSVYEPAPQSGPLVLHGLHGLCRPRIDCIPHRHHRRLGGRFRHVSPFVRTSAWQKVWSKFWKVISMRNGAQ